MNNQQKLEFYRTYYKNLSPEPFTIEMEEGKIIISNILSKKSYKEGGQAKTWKQKYNKKYGYDSDEGHTLKEISKKTGVSVKGLQEIYNKGIGAWKNNLSSVRVKGSFKKSSDTKTYPRSKRLGKEQWAMARVYSSVMGGKAAKVDAKELKMEMGGEIDMYYTETLPKKHEEILSRNKGFFKDFDLFEYKDVAYPDDFSQEVKAEIFYLNSLPMDLEFVYDYDNMKQVFFNYLRKNNLIISNEKLDELSDLLYNMTPLIMELKYYYNRPRPSQLAVKYNLDLEYCELESAETPSYPSGHSAQGIFMGHFLANIFPEHASALIEIGAEVGLSRLVGRVHFPTDDILGKYLGYSMYKYYYES